MNWNKVISILLALLYIVGAYFYAGTELAWKVAIGIIFPLGCIWFAEAMGAYTGPLSMSPTTNPTPEWLVRIGGWVLLLLPIFIGGICILARKI